MRLGDMTLDQSRNAEMLIVPVIDRIIARKETAELFDAIFSPGTQKRSTSRRGKAARELVHALLEHHYDDICAILGTMNEKTLEEIRQQKRSEVNAQIAEMLMDEDLVSFFISPETLVQVAQSASSQE